MNLYSFTRKEEIPKQNFLNQEYGIVTYEVFKDNEIIGKYVARNGVAKIDFGDEVYIIQDIREKWYQNKYTYLIDNFGNKIGLLNKLFSNNLYEFFGTLHFQNDTFKMYNVTEKIKKKFYSYQDRKNTRILLTNNDAEIIFKLKLEEAEKIFWGLGIENSTLLTGGSIESNYSNLLLLFGSFYLLERFIFINFNSTD